MASVFYWILLQINQQIHSFREGYVQFVLSANHEV